MTNPPPADRQSISTTLRTVARRAPVRRVLIALALVALAVFVFRDAVFGPDVDAYEVTRTDLVQSVVSSGRIMSPQRVSVGSVVTAAVARIPVSEGQTVRRGDVLIVLDDKDAAAAVAQARAALAQAEAKLRQLREVALPAAQQALAQAEANLLLARQQYERAQNLLAKGFVSQSALDDAKRNLDVSESQLRTARLQVATNGISGSDFVVAQAAREEAAANLAMANARLDQTVLRAPVDGTLIGRDVEPGNIAQPGKELMVLAPAGATQVIAQIDEKNLAQLALGQKALGSADAYPRERFDAVLAYINPGIDALRGSVEVKLDIAHPPEYLRQDMTVSVDIEVGRRASAIVVPAEAVNDAAGNAPWVLKVDGHHLARVPVKLGLKGDGRVEVVSGVAPGELVVVSAGTTYAPGERVRGTTLVRNGK